MGRGRSKVGGSRAGGGVPNEIKAKVQKVREMATKSSAYGQLQGDIKVSKDKNGNYNLSYTQVRNYGELKSVTIGVGNIPERQEITHTTYVLDKNGKRINTIRNTETKYTAKAANPIKNDWTGGNANRGTSRTATRKMKNAMKWAEHQTR